MMSEDLAILVLIAIICFIAGYFVGVWIMAMRAIARAEADNRKR